MVHRATYWTGTWDPAREAISKEVLFLRDTLSPRSPVVSLSSGQKSSWLYRDRVLRLSSDRWLIYRGAAAILERQALVSHVFGELGTWHPLRSLGRRPILFTVAVLGSAPDRQLLKKVSLFAPETDSVADALRSAGVPTDRICVIPPGVDVRHFVPAPFPDGRFTVLFASSPSRVEEMTARGIPLLVELARLLPDIDIVLLWRLWGNVANARAALVELRPPPNLRVNWGDLADPREGYWSAHAVVCAFEEGHGKSCPNSVIEGMACGRPAIVTSSVGISRLMEEHGGGVVTRRSATDLASGINQLRNQFSTLVHQARALAEREFDQVVFARRYAEAYRRCEE